MRTRGTLTAIVRAASQGAIAVFFTAVIATVFATTSSARAQASAGLSRDWNQPFGNAANTSACDVEPIRAAPEIAWQVRHDAILARPLVVNDRVLFVVREAKDRCVLFALRPATGELVARKTLDRGTESFEIVAEGDVVALLEPGRVRIHSVAGTAIKSGKSLELAWN